VNPTDLKFEFVSKI